LCRIMASFAPDEGTARTERSGAAECGRGGTARHDEGCVDWLCDLLCSGATDDGAFHADE
jgi:hypothetical protein